jgi:mannose-6-phosphate isomerase
MHLFEAFLAWEEVDPEGGWSKLADEIAELALSRFIDPVSGGLREFFSADWSPASGDLGRVVEPGHQFEWCWLLTRWGRMRGRHDAISSARRLFHIGASHGVDRRRKVAVNTLRDDFTVSNNSARLWPQTERMKAAAILLEQAQTDEDKAYLNAELEDAMQGLCAYLATPVIGLWWDKMNPDGSFIKEPAPASSLYHIALAIRDVAARRG